MRAFRGSTSNTNYCRNGERYDCLHRRDNVQPREFMPPKQRESKITPTSSLHPQQRRMGSANLYPLDQLLSFV